MKEGGILFDELEKMCTSSLGYNKKFLRKAISKINSNLQEAKGLKNLLKFPRKEGNTRQDLLVEEKSNGNLVSHPLIVKPSEKELRKLEMAEFYDTTCYLGAMSVVAGKIDATFHEAVRSIFDIDEITNASKDGSIQFRQGPIKSFERSKAKTQNDYGKNRFPTSAKVGDLVRCSLVFKRCQDCVDAISNLIRNVESKKTCIVQIARIKNMLVSFFP